MSSLYYIYPRWKNVSFIRIAEEHIKGLEKKVTIHRIPEDALDNLLWVEPRNILLHPVLYITMGDKPAMLNVRQKRLRTLIGVKKRLGGFETADSDRISPKAVEVLNQFDVVFLPSNFAINAYKNSDVEAPCELVPHGLSDIMLTHEKTISDPELKKLYEEKKKKEAIFVLFFCLHSEYRKGADIVADAMRFLQQKHSNLWIVIKAPRINNILQGLRMHHIKGWLNEDQLRQLYDICDILIVPSRGGGFELNALEGIARGIPTIAPNYGCFADYGDYIVPLAVTGHPRVFPDNPIHIGKGWETNADELSHVIEKVMFNLEAWKMKLEVKAEEIRTRYSWATICGNLYSLLNKYGFCD